MEGKKGVRAGINLTNRGLRTRMDGNYYCISFVLLPNKLT